MANGLQRDAGALGDFDDGNATQDIARVAALVAVGAVALDQALRFLKVQCGDGYAAALSKLADAQLVDGSIARTHRLFQSQCWSGFLRVRRYISIVRRTRGNSRAHA